MALPDKIAQDHTKNWTWTYKAEDLSFYAETSMEYVAIKPKDARRIARVPELEAALLAAEELKRSCEACRDLMNWYMNEYALQMYANDMFSFHNRVQDANKAIKDYESAVNGG